MVYVGVRKYSMTIYNESCDSFCALPLAAVLDGRFFCVHGGLSPELNYVEDINKVSVIFVTLLELLALTGISLNLFS